MTTKNFFDGGKQILDNTGLPLSGGLCYFYSPGTTTPKNTYTTSDLNVANANPVVLDSAGRANIWLNGNYRVIVRDSASNTIYDEDEINPSAEVASSAVIVSTAIDATYNGKTIEIGASSITLTLASAATLGSGWFIRVKCLTNGATIARANAGNTIDGTAANITMGANSDLMIQVIAAETGFITFGIQSRSTTFTPTVTLAGGAGNTVPVYAFTIGTYYRLGDIYFVSVILNGDGGAEGAGTGVINVALPQSVGTGGLQMFPCGMMTNSTDEYSVIGTISGSGSSTISLSYMSAANTQTNLTGAEQNNASRFIGLNFMYTTRNNS